MLRIIIDYYRDPLVNMALDEAIFMFRSKVGFDTLRLYMWMPSGVSIGRGQNLYETVNLECISRLGYKPVLRPTGGGALLHMTDGEITYSYVTGSENPVYSLDIQSSAIEIARGVYKALEILGVESGISGEYRSADEPLCYFRRGSSDILVNGKKISGSAQVRSGSSLLQHGTLLLKLDPDKWACVIRGVDNRSLRDKVASLEELGVSASINDVYDALVEGFTSVFGGEYFQGSLLPGEIQLADKLLREKYIPWLDSIAR